MNKVNQRESIPEPKNIYQKFKTQAKRQETDLSQDEFDDIKSIAGLLAHGNPNHLTDVPKDLLAKAKEVIKIWSKDVMKENTYRVNEVYTDGSIDMLYKYLDVCTEIKGLLNRITISDDDANIRQGLYIHNYKLTSLGRRKYAIQVVNLMDYSFDVYENHIKSCSFNNKEHTSIYLEFQNNTSMQFDFNKDIDMYVD